VFTINTDFFSPLARAATARARGTTTRVRDAAAGAPQTRLREENCAAKPLVSHPRVRGRRFFSRPPSTSRVVASRSRVDPRRRADGHPIRCRAMPPFATTRARSRRRETRATRATVRDATHLRRGRDLRERESHGVRASRCDASGGPL